MVKLHLKTPLTKDTTLFDTGQLVANHQACDKFIKIIKIPTKLVFKVTIFGLSAWMCYDKEWVLAKNKEYRSKVYALSYFKNVGIFTRLDCSNNLTKTNTECAEVNTDGDPESQYNKGWTIALAIIVPLWSLFTLCT